jgi:hypothetical protein
VIPLGLFVGASVMFASGFRDLTTGTNKKPGF